MNTLTIQCFDTKCFLQNSHHMLSRFNEEITSKLFSPVVRVSNISANPFLTSNAIQNASILHFRTTIIMTFTIKTS